MKIRYALALAALLPFQAQAAGSVSFSLVPQDSVIDIGETLLVDLIGTYIGDGVIVGGAANLGFDSSILEVLNVTLQAPKDIAESTRVIDNVAGTVSGIGFASIVGVTGSFTLATVEFQAKSAGLASLVLSNANDDIYVWANGLGDEIQFNGATGSITAVPEPEAYALMLAGLGLVGFAARRRG